MSTNEEVVMQAIAASRTAGKRFILAITGAPGAGKSTFADRLCNLLNKDDAATAEVLPLDGFHLDNAVLTDRGALEKKGAPETFDADGFAAALTRIARADKDVLVPVFDREADLARAGGRVIKTDTPIVIVEGNYLLLDRPEWTQNRKLFDLTIFLDVPMPVLEQRLIERWVRHGLHRDAAIARARDNDLVNANVVINQSLPPEMRIKGSS